MHGIFIPMWRPTASAAANATISYRTNVVDTSDVGSPYTYTYNSVDIGTAAPNRVVVVGFCGGAAGANPTPSVASMTINGVSASLAVRNNAVSEHTTELWYASVPTGTSVTITVVMNGDRADGCIGVWAVYTNTAAPSTTGNTNTAFNTTAASVSLSFAAGSVVIGFCRGTNGTATFTWGGGFASTDENFDAVCETARTYTGASAAFASAQSSLAFTVTPSASSSREMVMAVWGP